MVFLEIEASRWRDDALFRDFGRDCCCSEEYETDLLVDLVSFLVTWTWFFLAKSDR